MQPTLNTERLILRPFLDSDIPLVQKYASDKLIAAMTGPSIPHPYPEGAAAEWIGKRKELYEKNLQHVFAVTLKSNKEFVGCVGLYIDPTNFKAELGYWIAVPFWKNGYAHEASAAAIRYAFEDLKLHKVTAVHAINNPASGAVLRKLGMTKEGHLRQNFKKIDIIHDEDLYGLLRSEFPKR